MYKLANYIILNVLFTFPVRYARLLSFLYLTLNPYDHAMLFLQNAAINLKNRITYK